MSYSVNSTCWNCKKKEDCTDLAKVQDAATEIHKNNLGDGGHLGSGSIEIACFRLDAIDK